MGILDDYKKQFELDAETQNNNAPVDGINMTENEYDEYQKRLNEMRNEIKEADEKYNPSTSESNNNVFSSDVMGQFNEKYNKYTEAELKVTSEEVKPIIKRAFCPKCGKEIINTAPVMFNPFTMDKICKYDCECGWKANLDYAYPRVVFVDKYNYNNEFEAYTK